MHELTNNEVGQTCEQNLPGVPQNTVDDTDDEYKDRLRQEEAIAENWRLDEFGVVCCFSEHRCVIAEGVRTYLEGSSLRSDRWGITRELRTPEGGMGTNRKLGGE